MTSMQQAQIEVFGKRTCVTHNRKILEWFCESCSDVICANCISTFHKGHEIVQLSEVTPENKRKIETFISETEKNGLIQIQVEINSMQDILEKHLSHFESVEEEVENQGNKLKQDVDSLIAQTLSQLKFSKDENTSLIISYKTELEKKLKELKENLEQSKQCLQTGSDIQVFDIKSRIHTRIQLPTRPCLGTAKFTPNKNPNITHAIGKMNLTQPVQPKHHSLKKAGPEKTPASRLNILPKASVLSEWTPPFNIKSISPTAERGAWTCEMSSETVTDLTNTGEVYQQAQSRVRITDICVSPTTHSLWACSNKGNSVMEMISGTLTHRFGTKNEPLCLSITGDGHVLVGSKHRLTKYKQSGEQERNAKTSLFKKQIVCSPWRISECPVSENVAVVDGDWSDDGGKDKPLVKVMNKQLQEVCTYGQFQHASRPGLHPFDPYDVAYDSMGHLVIADYNNKCLHLLSGEGQYLRLLHTDTLRPQALCVDREGILWVGFGDNTISTKNVKLLQYTRE